MSKDIELLNYVYQNAEMGKNTVSQLAGITSCRSFRRFLLGQYKEYDAIFRKASKLIRQRGKEPKNIDMYSKLSTYAMVTMKTLRDRSPSHISEMLIQGNTMGIIDLTKRLKDYENADSKILKLAERLLTLEQDNIEECKRYLLVD